MPIPILRDWNLIEFGVGFRHFFLKAKIILECRQGIKKIWIQFFLYDLRQVSEPFWTPMYP